MMERSGSAGLVAAGAAKQHRLRQEAQAALRESIALYGGAARTAGMPDSESYRRFYFRYDVDVLSAQTLGRPDAENLNEKIRRDLG
jgi:hypothetical protein